MRLTIRHETIYTYDPAAGRVMLRLRLWPSAFDSQRTADWLVSVNEAEVPAQFVNGFGEGEAVWRSDENVETVAVCATGTVDTFDTAGVMRGLRTNAPEGVFMRGTRLTKITDSIRDLAATIPPDDGLTRLHHLKDTLRDHVRYEPGLTTAETTAAEALEIGAGVCQDHAHVFIAAARALDIPARYIAGYMLADEEDADRHATHAWVEAHVAGLGWVAFDPSNRVCPTDRYVRLTCGFDAFDATPIRGNVYAGGAESLNVSVLIEPVTQQQSQQQ